MRRQTITINGEEVLVASSELTVDPLTGQPYSKDLYADTKVGGMYVLDTTKQNNNKKTMFRNNRKTIFDDIGWIGERCRSQVALINSGASITADYTAAEYTDFLMYKQSLRVYVNNRSNWNGVVTYPVVPQHVYDDMSQSVKDLCIELGCQPV